MASVNKVILVGNLGRDPELRYTPGGTAVANFTLATNEAWTDKSGQKQERTEWHRIVVWAKQAEIVGEYLQSAIPRAPTRRIRSSWKGRCAPASGTIATETSVRRRRSTRSV